MLFDKFQKRFFYQRFASFAWIAFILILLITSKAERLPIKTYTVADGLLRDYVYKIKQDSRGFLWFCTPEGVSRFDGYAFTNFTAADGLPERHVNDFLETKKGEIWIATDAGLAKLNPTGLAGSKDNPLFTVILTDNPKAKSFQVLFEDESGAIWAGTGDGLYKLNTQDELEAVNLGKPLPNLDALFISSIIKDRRGTMWIGTTGGGLFRFLPNGQIEQFTTANGLSGNNIASLHEDKNGRMWVGMRSKSDAGLCLLVSEPQKNQNIVERYYTMKDGLPADWITSFLQTSDGKLWIGTTGGLCLWQGENNKSICKTYTAKNDLCDNDVWTLIEDKDGNLWTGSRCGAKKFARYGFTSYHEADGMDVPLVNSIFENHAGELFVSFDANRRTVSRFDGEKFELVKPNFSPKMDSPGWGWKQTVWQDSAGDWWFPTGDGLYRFPRPARFADLSRITPQKISFGAKGNEVFRFFEDSDGDFWIMTIGAVNELWRWERASDSWHDYTKDVEIGASRTASAFVEDKAGNLWIGTGSDTDDTALIRYRDGQFKIFTRTENKLLTGWIRDLFVDDKGRLWIADTATGVLRLDDVTANQLDFVRYTPAEGLSSIGVSCLTEDEFGRIYVGTGRGLDRLNPETGQIENFTTADGLPNSYIEVAMRDRKNNLWFGTADGLARFVPEPEKNRQSPNVLITGLRVAGVAQPISILGESEIEHLELDSDQRQMTINFVGLGANLGEKLRYEYRLASGDWMPTTERTLNFANLASGDYHFEIRAVTADRIYSQQAAGISFRIAAPIWQRPWFAASILALAVLAIYGFYRFRLNKLLEIERTRTRIATDLHDDIGANLSKISLLSEIVNLQLASKVRSAESNRLLDSIAEISRESVNSMSDIVWAINPNRDSLLEMTRRMRGYAEEIFVEKGIRVKFAAPDDGEHIKLSMDTRRELYLIFKEAVNNAAKHADCTWLEIDFFRTGGAIFLQISDNGQGFDVSNKRDGNGLANMQTRAEASGGKFEIESAEGSGTKVKIRFPQN